MAVDVDQHVDAVRRDPRRGLIVAHAADVDSNARPRLDAVVKLAVGIRAAIIGEHLDLRLVMQFEQLGHQIADGVIAQVGGNIADAQAPAGQIDGGVAAVGGSPSAGHQGERLT